MKLASGYKAFWAAAHKNYPDQMRPGGLLTGLGKGFLGECFTQQIILSAL